MRAGILVVVSIGVFASSLEGAFDAANVSHTPGDGVAHEMHDAHLGHYNDRGPVKDAGSDHHMCHCSVHVPPLAFGLGFAVRVFSDDQYSSISQSRSHLNGPPPLPPPIV